jgi:integrase
MLAAATEPWRTLFALAAVSGARLSELLALRWSDLELSDADAACVHIHRQIDRRGKPQPLKTDSAERSVELPRSLVVLLLEHRLRSTSSVDASTTELAELAYVFATRSGRPLGQRNVLRALRRAQLAARTPDGAPTFPALFEPQADELGRWIKRRSPVPRGSVPSFHGFRHSAASHAIAAGDSAEEVSWQLGHKHSGITRAVYVQEVKSAERRAQMRAKLEARHGSMLSALLGSGLEAADRQQPAARGNVPGADVLPLRQTAAGSSSQQPHAPRSHPGGRRFESG